MRTEISEQRRGIRPLHQMILWACALNWIGIALDEAVIYFMGEAIVPFYGLKIIIIML